MTDDRYPWSTVYIEQAFRQVKHNLFRGQVDGLEVSLDEGNQRFGIAGFGWGLEEFEGRRNIGHGGSTSGFSASLQRFPDDRLTVIVLCNSGENGVAGALAKSVARIYFDAHTRRSTSPR